MNNNVDHQCPNCEKEMKKGFIQSGTRLAWVPKVSKASVEPSLNKDSVLLSKQNRFSSITLMLIFVSIAKRFL